MALGKTFAWIKSAVLETALTGDPSATLGEAKKAFVKEMVARDISSLAPDDAGAGLKKKLKAQAASEETKKKIVEAVGVEVEE